MRRTDRVAVALITGTAALAGATGLARTTSLGPYHHPPLPQNPLLGQRVSELDRLDGSLRRAMKSRLPSLPSLGTARGASAAASGGTRVLRRVRARSAAAPAPWAPAARSRVPSSVAPPPAAPTRRRGAPPPVTPAPAAPVAAPPEPAPPAPVQGPAAGPGRPSRSSGGTGGGNATAAPGRGEGVEHEGQ